MLMKPKKRVADIDHKFLKLLEDLTVRPVFIMGDHRSGTTLLYQLLDMTNCFNIVRAYHVIYYGEVLSNYIYRREDEVRQQLDQIFNRSDVKHRIIDNVSVTSSLPEEYGFLLGQSPRPQLNHKTLSKFIEVCKKVQFISDPQKALLLKNPWDFTNFMFIKQMFPETKLIFLHRNPIQTINSQLRAARAMYIVKSKYHALLDRKYDRLWDKPIQLYILRMLFSMHFNLGFRVVTRHVQRATNYFLENVHHLHDEDYISLKYEDLCTNPHATIGKVLHFLKLRTSTPVSYDDFIQPRQVDLLDEVQSNQSLIIKRLQPYLEYCHYASCKESRKA